MSSNVLYATDKAQHSYAGLLEGLPMEIWTSMSTQAGLTLNDKCAVRSSSASFRRLANAATSKVRSALSGAALPVIRPGQPT